MISTRPVTATAKSIAAGLVKDRHTKEPAPEETRAALATCHRRGLIIISTDTFRNVIRISVPLIASDEQIAEGLHVFEEALGEVQA